MINNMHNQKLSAETLTKFSTIPEILYGIPNTIPSYEKRAFNFKGRKSSVIATKIISYLTTTDDKICDPFAGAFTFPISSSIINRKTLGIELDNYSFSFASIMLKTIDYALLEKMFNQVKEKAFDSIMSLYKTSCCEQTNYIQTLYFDPETSEYYNPKPHREIKNKKNIKLYHKCPNCGAKSKQFDLEDEKLLKLVNTYNVTKFPKHELIENSRINITKSKNASTYDRNFSTRNKYALLLLQKALNTLENCAEKDILQLSLIASLTLSKITQYGSSSDVLYHVLREKAQDMNVWYLFKSKYLNILKYMKKYSKTNSNIPITKYLTLINSNYKDILLKPEYKKTFDLIYTDPPYTDQIPYLERHQLYRDWLFYVNKDDRYKLTADMLNNEIVVTNAPSRPNKNIENYLKDIDEMISVFAKIVKNNCNVALTLNLGKKRFFKILSSYISYARKHGFEYVIRIDLEKNDPTQRKQSAWKNTLSKEMLVFFSRLSFDNSYWYIDNQNIEIEIGKLVYKTIINNNGTTKTNIFNQIAKRILHKEVHKLSDYEKHKINNLLKEQFVINDKTSIVSINPDKLYVSIEDNKTLFNKLYDIVPIIIKNLLKTKNKFTLDDIYFEISSKLCNGDPTTMAQIFTNSEYELQIKNLINNYCEMDDKNSYKKKVFDVSYNENAIDISTLEGNEFEELLKKLLQAEGYEDVIRVGQACDRGVDLRAKRINNSSGLMEGYIFQAKRWVSNVGSTPIQRLHSMMQQTPEEIHHAICITTSDYTKHGIQEARNTGVKIVGGIDLIKRIDNVFPGMYYHGLLNFDNN